MLKCGEEHARRRAQKCGTLETGADRRRSVAVRGRHNGHWKQKISAIVRCFSESIFASTTSTREYAARHDLKRRLKIKRTTHVDARRGPVLNLTARTWTSRHRDKDKPRDGAPQRRAGNKGNANALCRFCLFLFFFFFSPVIGSVASSRAARKSVADNDC